jgi:hypothetical protein
MKTLISRFLNDESAATAIEYGLRWYCDRDHSRGGQCRHQPQHNLLQRRGKRSLIVRPRAFSI